jgi:hypothetical protein
MTCSFGCGNIKTYDAQGQVKLYRHMLLNQSHRSCAAESAWEHKEIQLICRPFPASLCRAGIKKAQKSAVELDQSIDPTRRIFLRVYSSPVPHRSRRRRQRRPPPPIPVMDLCSTSVQQRGGRGGGRERGQSRA